MLTIVAFTENDKIVFFWLNFLQKKIFSTSQVADSRLTLAACMLRKMFATVAESQLYSSFSVIAESESLVEGTYHLPESD